MPRVLAALPGTRLAVAGDGAQRDVIAADVGELGFGDSVRLLGRLFDQDLRAWYRAADLSVLPTQELEGFGLATAEASGCGTPVLGTPAGATAEILAPIDPRLVTAGMSSDELANWMISLLSRPDELAAIAARARARVHPAMGWPLIARRYIELYERTRSAAAIPPARVTISA